MNVTALVAESQPMLKADHGSIYSSAFNAASSGEWSSRGGDVFAQGCRGQGQSGAPEADS